MRKVVVFLACFLSAFLGIVANAQNINDSQVSVVESGQSTPTDWSLGQLLQRIINNIRANRTDLMAAINALSNATITPNSVYVCNDYTNPVTDIIWDWGDGGWLGGTSQHPSKNNSLKKYLANQDYPIEDGDVVLYAPTGVKYEYKASEDVFKYQIWDGENYTLYDAGNEATYPPSYQPWEDGANIAFVVTIINDSASWQVMGNSQPQEWVEGWANPPKSAYSNSVIVLKSTLYANDIKLGSMYPSLSLIPNDNQATFNTAVANRFNSLQYPTHYRGQLEYVVGLNTAMLSISEENLSDGTRCLSLESGLIYTYGALNNPRWTAGSAFTKAGGDYFQVGEFVGAFTVGNNGGSITWNSDLQKWDISEAPVVHATPLNYRGAIRYSYGGAPDTLNPPITDMLANDIYLDTSSNTLYSYDGSNSIWIIRTFKQVFINALTVGDTFIVQNLYGWRNNSTTQHNVMLTWNGATWDISPLAASAPTWGNITGTLSDQEDLNEKLKVVNLQNYSITVPVNTQAAYDEAISNLPFSMGTLSITINSTSEYADNTVPLDLRLDKFNAIQYKVSFVGTGANNIVYTATNPNNRNTYNTFFNTSSLPVSLNVTGIGVLASGAFNIIYNTSKFFGSYGNGITCNEFINKQNTVTYLTYNNDVIQQFQNEGVVLNWNRENHPKIVEYWAIHDSFFYGGIDVETIEFRGFAFVVLNDTHQRPTTITNPELGIIYDLSSTHELDTFARKAYVDNVVSTLQLPEHYKGQLEYVCADAATREALTDVAVGAKALTIDDNIVAYYDDTGGFSAWAYLESLTPQAGDYYYVLNLTNLADSPEGSITYNGATWDIAPDHYHQPDNETIVLNEAGQLAVANPEGFGVKATPDYANTETTNRIPTSSGSWTADRDGWVRLTSVATGSSGQTGMRASINGKLVVTKWVNGITQNDTSEILPVKAGDVIILETIGVMSSQGCHFIPPKYEYLQANTANVSNVVVDCVPDYANMTAGLAGGAAGAWSWTAPQSGFISYDIYGNSSILINGSVVATAESTTMTTGITPVNVGDVATSTGASLVYVRFVPPRYVLAGKTIPVASDNYSLQETDTGKTWIDGKPIYQRTFLVAAAMGTWNIGTQKVVISNVSSWNVDKMIGPAEGISGNGYGGSFACGVDNNALTMNSPASFTGNFATTTNNYFTVRYTKTTD